jgi:hypothetical protein
MHGLSPLAYARARQYFGDSEFWKTVRDVDPQLCADIVTKQTVAKLARADADAAWAAVTLDFVDQHEHDVVFRLWLAAYDHLDDLEAWRMVATRARVRSDFLAGGGQDAPWRVRVRDREVLLIANLLKGAFEKREARLATLFQDLGIESERQEPLRLDGVVCDSESVARVDDPPECVVCMDAPATVLLPCGHTCACEDCSDAWQAISGTCPMCRSTM